MNKFNFKALSASLLIVSAVASCTDLTEVNKELDSLDSRVSALETIVNSLNENINSLMILANNQTINKVEQDGDNYMLTLANGQVITICQGTLGIGNTPILSIGSDGYWVVDYGNGPEPVLSNGKPVPAIGTDGITPKFGVDDDNYWIVSYDGGKTWENVLYSNGENAGQKVKAYDAGGSDSYFHNVEYDRDGGVFILTLKNGMEYTIPVVSDFLCVIEAVTDEIVKFAYGEYKTFTVHMTGVSDYTLLSPDGWEAVIQGEGEYKILRISAPQASTKATIADSESDVSIIAFTKSYLSTCAKVRVALSGKEMDMSPFVSPSSLEVGTNDAKVRVLSENAEKWFYMLTESSAAPHAIEVIENGIEGSEKVFTLGNLKQGHTYYLYVVGQNGENISAVAGCSFTTLLSNDRYEAFENGEDIMICGRVYNKDSYTATLLVAESDGDNRISEAMANGGVVFVDTPDGTSFNTGSVDVANNSPVAVVGRYMDSRAKVTCSGRMIAKAGLAMQYIDFDGSVREGNEIIVGTMAGDVAEYIHFDSCRIRHRNATTLISSDRGGSYWRSLRFENCDFHFVEPKNGTTMQLTRINDWDCIAKVEEIVLDNNIFYAPSDTRFMLLKDGSTFLDGTSFAEYARMNIVVTNNTFYGCISDWGIMRIYIPGNIDVTRNIFWSYPDSISGGIHLIWFYGDDGVAPTINYDYNICYRYALTCLVVKGGVSTPSYLPSNNAVNPVAFDPLEGSDPSNYDFTPIRAYKNYGAQR